MSDETKLQVRKIIKAKKEKVFEAWTNPHLLKTWFAPGELTVQAAEVSLKVKGAYKIQMKDDEGETMTATGIYQEIIPNQKLVFTLGWGVPDRHEMLVTVELKDKDGGTEVILTHERFANVESLEQHKKGWISSLENLSKLFQ